MVNFKTVHLEEQGTIDIMKGVPGQLNVSRSLWATPPNGGFLMQPCGEPRADRQFSHTINVPSHTHSYVSFLTSTHITPLANILVLVLSTQKQLTLTDKRPSASLILPFQIPNGSLFPLNPPRVYRSTRTMISLEESISGSKKMQIFGGGRRSKFRSEWWHICKYVRCLGVTSFIQIFRSEIRRRTPVSATGVRLRQVLLS